MCELGKKKTTIELPKVVKRNRAAKAAVNQKSGPMKSKKDRAEGASVHDYQYDCPCWECADVRDQEGLPPW